MTAAGRDHRITVAEELSFSTAFESLSEAHHSFGVSNWFASFVVKHELVVGQNLALTLGLTLLCIFLLLLSDLIHFLPHLSLLDLHSLLIYVQSLCHRVIWDGLYAKRSRAFLVEDEAALFVFVDSIKRIIHLVDLFLVLSNLISLCILGWELAFEIMFCLIVIQFLLEFIDFNTIIAEIFRVFVVRKAIQIVILVLFGLRCRHWLINFAQFASEGNL